MRQLSAKIATCATSAALVLGSFTEAFSMPVVPAPPAFEQITGSRDVQQVQWRGYGGGPYYRGGWGGYHGYGYNSYNNWYPLAAFGAGALVGGLIASQPRYYAYAPPPADGGLNPQHYEWCYARYRSYRSFDNTFQPNYGPRRQCLSPYY
jgi:hypothetical protein